MMATQQLTIVSIIEETLDTKSFMLKPKGDALKYRPGQFITVIHPTMPHERRSYSLSSHPTLDRNLQITVKRIANGAFSRWLFDHAKVGDKIETIGASGFFTLPDELDEQSTCIFFAAGSGITPVFSLLKETLFIRKRRAVLVYSNRSEADSIFYDQLMELEKKLPDLFSLHLLISNRKDLSRARLNGPLLTQLIREHVPDKSKALAFLCGPQDYMLMATISLRTDSFPSENIRTENFSTDKPRTKERPPDTEPHKVSVEYQGKKFSLTVQYPTTILHEAQRQGIDLPYSCEAGRCGTCAATCGSGKVWMSRNEVLLDKEIARGRVLTCTGYPIGGDVELVFKM